MYRKTLSYYSTVFYRSFAAYTSEQLQQAGLSFGLLFLVIYIGKRPGCSPSELTKELDLDWGHCQRCLAKLEQQGFITRRKQGRSYALTLTEQGQQAFAIGHQVFFDWDSAHLGNLSAAETNQLFALLQKVAEGVPNHVRNHHESH